MNLERSWAGREAILGIGEIGKDELLVTVVRDERVCY
jgi:hypothetical protein